MTNPQDISALIARVEEATGPDRESDAAIWDAVYIEPPEGGPYVSWRAAARAFGWDIHVTASLDAALALVEQVLPGWLRGLDEIENGDHFWRANLYNAETRQEVRAEASTPAIALILALLKALHSQASAGGTK